MIFINKLNKIEFICYNAAFTCSCRKFDLSQQHWNRMSWTSFSSSCSDWLQLIYRIGCANLVYNLLRYCPYNMVILIVTYLCTGRAKTGRTSSNNLWTYDWQFIFECICHFYSKWKREREGEKERQWMSWHDIRVMILVRATNRAYA